MSDCVSDDAQPGGVVWRVIGASVRGTSHHRSGIPNQDAIRWLPKSGIGPPLALLLSDGHGSALNFRSDVGAHLAVNCAAPLIQSLCEGQLTPFSLSAVKRIAQERLPVEIVRAWQDSVDAHLAKYRFTEGELEGLVDALGTEACEKLECHPRLAYGATLLAVLITQSYFLFLQLGDGDILAVTADGAVSRPVPSDARLFANETTSLCRDGSWGDFRVRFAPRYDNAPVMILVSTDGYANSFVDDAGFLAVGRDILEILRVDGATAIESNLDLWLQEASEAGSGDDITVGLAYVADIDSQNRFS
jgi:hypothetical protein